ncbi:MAG TPA: hypothetical protein VJ553_05175 [Candidatus Paceibacterota bacterium]|nr:hypothetical protein [Candidatus Paceibacterota bacterium]
MKEIALSVLGFVKYHLDPKECIGNETMHIAPISFDHDTTGEVIGVVLHETEGPRYIVIQMDDEEAAILNRIFKEPGEPLIMHEMAARILRVAGVTIEGGCITTGATPEILCFATRFRHGDRTWEESMFAFDTVGFALAGKVPTYIDEDLLIRLSRDVLPLERLGLGPGQMNSVIAIEQLARALPSEKLTRN